MTQGRLEWASGDTADKTIVVPILGDRVDKENGEVFAVSLEEPLGGRLGRSAGTVTIQETPQRGNKSGGGIVGLANLLLLGLGALARLRARAVRRSVA